jgi:hypothetical protein
MNLQDFVVETLSSIVDATNQARQRLGTDLVAPGISLVSSLDGLGFTRVQTQKGLRDFQSVGFDVAVTLTTDKAGKLSLGVAALGVGADIGGDRRTEHISRVRFKIPLALPPSQTGQAA